MRLRLLVEVEADAYLVEDIAGLIEDQATVDVSLRDDCVPLTGRLVGATPTDEGP